jgi:hypothetical protein
MTPKEKSIELVEEYQRNIEGIHKADAQICALIAVDEILNALSYKVSSNFEELKYYEEVKQEIKKL